MVGLNSSMVDVDVGAQGGARHSSDIPSSPCGLGSLSRVRKAHGVNLGKLQQPAAHTAPDAHL